MCQKTKRYWTKFFQSNFICTTISQRQHTKKWKGVFSKTCHNKQTTNMWRKHLQTFTSHIKTHLMTARYTIYECCMSIEAKAGHRMYKYTLRLFSTEVTQSRKVGKAILHIQYYLTHWQINTNRWMSSITCGEEQCLLTYSTNLKTTFTTLCFSRRVLPLS